MKSILASFNLSETNLFTCSADKNVQKLTR